MCRPLSRCLEKRTFKRALLLGPRSGDSPFSELKNILREARPRYPSQEFIRSGGTLNENFAARLLACFRLISDSSSASPSPKSPSCVLFGAEYMLANRERTEGGKNERQRRQRQCRGRAGRRALRPLSRKSRKSADEGAVKPATSQPYKSSQDEHGRWKDGSSYGPTDSP
jgi:hypothetical protein